MPNLGGKGEGECFKEKEDIGSLGRAVRMRSERRQQLLGRPGQPLTAQCLQTGVGVKGRVCGRKWGW